MRFALRHWTAILIIVLIAGWAIFYLPGTPSYAIFELKQAIDARDGSAAASYVDFKKVVENAATRWYRIRIVARAVPMRQT